MVCLGNICRSPLAQGILERKVAAQGLDWEIDSAGTGSWHIGEQPDPRSVYTAGQHGLDISAQRARQFGRQDLKDFDLILAMDQSNYRDILRLAQSPAEAKKVKKYWTTLLMKTAETCLTPIGMTMALRKCIKCWIRLVMP